MTRNIDSIVVIDDDEKLLAELVGALRAELQEEAVEVCSWLPTEDSPQTRFNELVDDRTVLVITDYDLTSRGVTGLFGASIVSWCQRRAIPAGNFSRGNPAQLPAEPDLFELRIPTTMDEAAAFSAAVFRGFRAVRNGLLAESASLPTLRSPAAALAGLVGKPNLETSFALYLGGTADASGTLLELIRESQGSSQPADASVKTELLVYLLGHVLVNAILRYPGPVLTKDALRAYVAVGPSEELDGLFDTARYEGPFDSLHGGMYWRDEVDVLLDELSGSVGDVACETMGEFRRVVVERALGRAAARHGCTRCDGVHGGFWCPFTRRAICERGDCSVGATSWIPAGADLARVERDFYDEWAPVLGL